VNQARTDSGSTPLHMAAQIGNLDVVRYLASEANADVNQARTDNGATPLYIASQIGNLDVVLYIARYFGEAHADDVNQTTNNGYTPLPIDATQHGQEKSSQHGAARQIRRGQRFLKIMKLVRILIGAEHRQARKPCEIDNNKLHDRVVRFKRALRHREVPSTEQMRIAVLRLVGNDSSMSEKAKSTLTLAYQTQFMLMRAALRRG